MNVFFSKTSLKHLAKIEKGIRSDITIAIEGLPDKGDIRKMKGRSINSVYRLRVGRYRVLFVWEKDVIRVLDIDTRGDIYK